MRKGLGRGLDAILPQPDPADAPPAPGIQTVPIASLVPNRLQPRSTFDEEGLEELARSIRAQGVIQPLVVAPRGDGTFTIVAGERRWRAAQRCGLEELPVVVREVDDDRQLLELALVENLQRADLNAMEEAEALSQSAGSLRAHAGRDRASGSVARAPRSPTAFACCGSRRRCRTCCAAGAITPGQARPLLAIDSTAAPDRARASRPRATGCRRDAWRRSPPRRRR